MKVIKAEDVPTSKNEEQVIDQKKVEELREKFDILQAQLNEKEYGVALNKEQTDFLFNEFYGNVSWKGYESYAISETYDKLHSKVKKDELNASFSVEIIEATFHFLKNYIGSGSKAAKVFRQLCDQFAVPMQEINNDRQQLKDLSLELVATEQGISVETLVEGLKRENPSFRG
jgi:hypothetical protein